MRPNLALTLAFGLLSTPLLAQQATDAVAPEGPGAGAVETGSEAVSAALAEKDAGRPVTAGDWMVAAANPEAVEAGARVLEAGGTAADAMIAVQTVLGLVEPQSSGLGGGSFLVWYDAATGEVTTLDGREKAPMSADPTLFLDENGETMEFVEAVIGGRSVGVPGTPALMQAAHDRWGRAEWGGLFADAIALAEGGFEVSPRLAGLVADDVEPLGRFASTAAYFLPDGTPIAAGDTLTNPDYARTLRTIAALGSDAFYEGEIAEGIVSTVRSAAGNPGLMTMDDLAAYDVIERAPVCVEYHAHDVCGMGPPSSGALTVGQVLGMLEDRDLATLGPDSAEAWRLIGDASRLAFADRGRYMADSDFVPVPVIGLVDPGYLSDRGALLDSDEALGTVEAGEPTYDHALLWSDGESFERPSTSHISIVDADGNALSMTTTIEGGFGSRLMAPGGFLLNNELTDFSFATHENGWPVANRVEPGKRPRSSMAPTIVLRDGEPVLVIGSPGGSRIIGYVLQAVIAVIDWDMDVQQAVSMGHVLNRFGPMDLEAGTDVEAMADDLSGIGFETNVTDLNSGLHAIEITPEGLEGGADPRREGIALGG